MEHIHETTWEDIARGYRHVLEQVLDTAGKVNGHQLVKNVNDIVKPLDVEADLLAKKEAHHD